MTQLFWKTLREEGKKIKLAPVRESVKREKEGGPLTVVSSEHCGFAGKLF